MAMKKTHYDTLGLSLGCTTKEITKAYRTQALKYHPDKNPDNPVAAQRFHEISIAYETLTHAEKKAKYDQELQAQLQRQQKHAELDQQRRAMKESLERGEREARQRHVQAQEAKAQQAQELEAYRQELMRQSRLREKGASRRQPPRNEDVGEGLPENVAMALKSSQVKQKVAEVDRSVMAKWSRKSKTTWTERTLLDHFRSVGPVDHIIMSTKKPTTALIVFQSLISAYVAVTQPHRVGGSDQPFRIQWASGTPPEFIQQLEKDAQMPSTTKGTSTQGNDHQPDSSHTLASVDTAPPATTMSSSSSRQPPPPPSFTSFPGLESDGLSGSTTSASPAETLSLDDYETLTFINLRNWERQQLSEQLRQEQDGSTAESTNEAPHPEPTSKRSKLS
ncbi:DnaJ (Hsp40), sub C, member 17 [Dispira parvispora]|uniref:DnaJ (Hsp40), sub C, member 17 n=1 Tax=Dispira parvispora TaxID=1520584 RepID=A0A9W8APW6_9FUNG|nr:DnaJ (Hsp40), sub C, member 17 [Dispira parvispora]